MSRVKIITAIDVGSSKVATVIGQITEEKKINVIGASSVPSLGIKKGQIVDIEQAANSIVKSVESAERMASCSVDKVLVTIGGAHINSLNSHGVVAVGQPEKEIIKDDVNRVIDAARAISLPSTREILHVIPRSYTVDSQEGIADPIGMSGVRLEVETHIVTASTTAVKNLKKCVGELGCEIGGIFFSGVSSADAILSETEKDLGVILLDIGGGTTSLVAVVDGSPVFTTVIPIGAINVTRDLATGLRFSNLESAEKVKIAISREDKNINPDKDGENGNRTDNDELDLARIGVNEETRKVSKKTLVDGIVKPRLIEIFGLVSDEIKKNNLSGLTPSGVVLTGGGALTVGAVETCKRCLSLPVRTGFPPPVSGLVDEIGSPAFSATIGLLFKAAKSDIVFPAGNFSKVGKIAGRIPIKGVVEKFGNFLKSLLP